MYLVPLWRMLLTQWYYYQLETILMGLQVVRRYVQPAISQLKSDKAACESSILPELLMSAGC